MSRYRSESEAVEIVVPFVLSLPKAERERRHFTRSWFDKLTTNVSTTCSLEVQRSNPRHESSALRFIRQFVARLGEGRCRAARPAAPGAAHRGSVDDGCPAARGRLESTMRAGEVTAADDAMRIADDSTAARPRHRGPPSAHRRVDLGRADRGVPGANRGAQRRTACVHRRDGGSRRWPPRATPIASFAAAYDRGPLQGIPISLKDLIDVEGVPTTAGLARDR